MDSRFRRNDGYAGMTDRIKYAEDQVTIFLKTKPKYAVDSEGRYVNFIEEKIRCYPDTFQKGRQCHNIVLPPADEELQQ